MGEILEIGQSGYGVTKAADMALGKKVMEKLIAHYPLHNWGVEVNHESGHVVIRLIYKDFEGTARVSNYGHVLHIKKIENESDLEQKVIRAGGEWLERYKMPRGKATPYAIIDAKNGKLDLSMAS